MSYMLDMSVKGYDKGEPVSEIILHVSPSHKLFESDQETELSGNRKKSEDLKEAMSALCQVWTDFLVKSVTIRSQVSIGNHSLSEVRSP